MTVTWTTPTDIDLSDQEFWGRPPAEREAAFALLRRQAPFSFHAEPVVPFIPEGPGYYAVTRHADVDAISSQPAVFCSGQGAISIADMPAELTEFYGSVISMDDPRHAKIRRIVARAFTPKMLESVMDSVEVLATELVARARRLAEDGDGTFDLVAEVAAPLPLRVICDMMGVPETEHELVLRCTNIILSGGDPEFIADENEAVRISLEAGGELAGLMTRLAAERAETPTQDLTSALVHAEVDGERLTHQEIASFFILLCVAGNETTRTAISQGVLALSEFPDQRDRWMADPGLTKTAVEEIVRWATPVIWMRRTATRDVELSGRQFRAGDKFLLFYSSANRDEDVFADPYTLDLGRSPNPHLGFGGRGPHFCLGANLARREIAVTFRTLFAQVPHLQVVGEPPRLRSSFINGIKNLPVSLRA
ncbi:cytochrome P450 [Rhodococcus sp. X156]|uniref:cytochrome P450 n=1 Tax=Rhodococcus sp. X156 TaxID=2499145 RepID=UPI0019D0EA7F|nr:cytochrome P450 [Rhodococcus sp. X156]